MYRRAQDEQGGSRDLGALHASILHALAAGLEKNKGTTVRRERVGARKRAPAAVWIEAGLLPQRFRTPVTRRAQR